MLSIIICILSPRVNKRACAFELVHSNVWDPCLVQSLNGCKNFVIFVDDFPRVTWFYLMKSRFELFSHFSVFCAEIQTRFHEFVQALRSNNAKKYFLEPF